MSEQAGVYAALAAAQGKFPAIPKTHTATVTSDKGRYTYNYADLADVMTSIRPVLSECGLAVTQPIEMLENGRLVLRTSLVYKDGSAIHSMMHLPNMEGKPQAFGSALTYARRYALSSLLGIATEEDDDATAAQDPGPTERAPRQTRQPQQSAKPPARKLDTTGLSPEAATNAAIAATAGVDDDPWKLNGVGVNDLVPTMRVAIETRPWDEVQQLVPGYVERLGLTEHETAQVRKAFAERKSAHKQANLLAAG